MALRALCAPRGCGVRCAWRATTITTVPPSPMTWLPTLQQRWMRLRARESKASAQNYSIDNPITAKTWPPLEEVGEPITLPRCREIIHHLHLEEMEKLKAQRTFIMPDIRPGDLVEVRYELSRSQQTFAVFQGYCVEVRNKRLNSNFILKNTYDGVGVEQLFPFYSPRILDVRMIRALPRREKVCPLPRTRNYRYMWQHYVRGKYSRGKKTFWKDTPVKAGIMSLEPRIRKELSQIRTRYQMQRKEANLPPYIFPGPYSITRRQTREVKAEMHRRMLIYAHDDRRQRLEKIKKREAKSKWGVFRMEREHHVAPAVTRLPADHPLKTAPK